MSKAADVDLIAVTKRYGDTLAVDAVDLHIPADTYCCLLGPSGCGKTSTLRMIAGHEAITEGEIVVGGERVNALTPAQRGTALMFQEYDLLPHLDCRDNVAFRLKLRGVAKAQRHAPAASGCAAAPRPSGTIGRNTSSGWSAWRVSPGASRPSSRAASSSAWRSPGR